MANEKIIVKETINKVVISSVGAQGPRGKGILNGVGAPSNNLGLTGDFYYNTATTDFYGPKLTDSSWAGASRIQFLNQAANFATTHSWELAQVQGTGTNRHVTILHNLGFYPNVTVKSSSGDILETGIDYDSPNQITLTMAQPFSGTAYLS